MKKSTIERFRRKLAAKREHLADQLDNITNNSLASRQEAAGEVSAMPIHMADIGSDTYEREFALDIIEGENREIREIDAALRRIDEGRYGVCERCGGKVGYRRLLALPYARLCIQCQRSEEEGGA